MRIDYIIQTIVAALCVAVMVWVLQGCKTCDCIPETIVRDSIRVEQRLDSIYLYEKDSIYIHAKADTIYVNKYVTRYKDVLKIERDTIYQENKVVEVKEVKYIPDIIKWLAWIGGFALLYVLIRIGLWVYRKFVLKV